MYWTDKSLGFPLSFFVQSIVIFDFWPCEINMYYSRTKIVCQTKVAQDIKQTIYIKF